MGSWERVHVAPDFAGVTRQERQGGSYRRYLPDLLCSSSNALEPAVLEHAAGVSVALARLGARLRANPLPILYSTLLRSESISSSWIEGIRETPHAVAVAQIGEEGASHTASQILRNVTAMREAIELLGAGEWTSDAICSIHHDLLPWHRRGYRAGQVWIGGTHAFNADYAGPPGETVPGYVDDLLSYANSSGDLPVVQAAVIHAQFETIHPFEDGNGRVGRALVHGVWKRSGLIDSGVIPLSTALRNDVKGYVGALTDYRYDGDATVARLPALSRYVDRFLAYTETATAAAERFVDAATAVHERWRGAVADVRSDSSVHLAVDLVVEHPVVSARFLSERLQISSVSAHHVARRLVEAGILTPATGKYRRSALFQADDVIRLLEYASEAGPRVTPPDLPGPARSDPALVHRCAVATSRGPCRNRVAEPGRRCWRHAVT